MLVSGEGLAAIGTEHHDGERSESGVAELGLRTAEGDPKQQQQQQHGQRLRRFNESFSGVRSFQGAVQHGGVGGERGDAWAGGGFGISCMGSGSGGGTVSRAGC
jgi:hypothetical protein